MIEGVQPYLLLVTYGRGREISMIPDDIDIRNFLGLNPPTMSDLRWDRTMQPWEKQQYLDLMSKSWREGGLWKAESLVLQKFEARIALAREQEGLENRQKRWSDAMDAYRSNRDWREEKKKESPIGRLEPEWFSPEFGLKPTIFFVEEEIGVLEDLLSDGRCLSDALIARLIHLRSIRQSVREEFNAAEADYERLLQEDTVKRIRDFNSAFSRKHPYWLVFRGFLLLLGIAAGGGIFLYLLQRGLLQGSLHETVAAIGAMQTVAMIGLYQWYTVWRSHK